MPNLMSAEEWLAKASYEGGLLEGIEGYGLTEADLDPNDDPELYRDITKIVEAIDRVREEIDRTENKLQEFEC